MTRSPFWTLLVCSLLGSGTACAPGAATTMTGADDGSSGTDDDDDKKKDDEDDGESETSSEDEEDPEGSTSSTTGSSSNSSSTSGGTSSSSNGTSNGSVGTNTSDPTSSTSLSGGDTSTVDCTFQVMASLSQNIGTVGIVEWSVDLGAVDQAEIQFGLDTSYGMTAPVDLSEPGYRTLLLGMKPNQQYHFRIVASGGGQRCDSGDQTIMTQAPPNGVIPRLTINTPNPGARAGGFKVLSIYGSGYVIILDTDGDPVWWYKAPGTVNAANGLSRARMSYDGKSMWMRNTNVAIGGPAPQSSSAAEVSMEGTELRTIGADKVNGHHDLTVTPENGVAFIAYEDGGSSAACDEIVELDEAGNTTTVYRLRDALSALLARQCHSNSIHYNEFDDTYTVSQRDFNTIVKVSRSGELKWVLGGQISTFQGDVSWNVQHGHHNVSENEIVFFNNETQGPSAAVELQLMGTQATRTWSYQTNLSSFTLGDVQRLPNGNTLVVYSNSGEIHEVDEQGNLVESLSAGLSGAFGYIEARPTLYGPPPR